LFSSTKRYGHTRKKSTITLLVKQKGNHDRTQNNYKEQKKEKNIVNGTNHLFDSGKVAIQINKYPKKE
jgi:hypothetical protein